MLTAFGNYNQLRRRLILLFVWLLLPSMCDWGRGIEASDDGNESGAANESSQVSSNSDVSRTLEQLKKNGFSRSRYAAESALKSFDSAQQPEPNLKEFREVIHPILNKACLDCHGEDLQEGNIRIDALDPDLLKGNDVDWWNEVFAVVTKGEMPPPESNSLTEEERTQVVHWLSGELQNAAIVRRAKSSRSTFRRMTRYEFNYALQDLLGLPWDFAKDLPPDPNSEEGFQNNSSLLHMSVEQFEIYYRLARIALKRATIHGERPKVLYWDVSIPMLSKFEWPKLDSQLAQVKKDNESDLEKQKVELDRLEETFKKPRSRTYYQDLVSGRTAVATWEYYDAKHAIAPVEVLPGMPSVDDAKQFAVLPGGNNHWLNIELGDQLPDEGMLRVTVRASRTSVAKGKTPSLKLMFGWQASNEGRALLPVSEKDTPITAPEGAPEIYRWEIPLGEIYPRNSVRKVSSMGQMPSPSEYIRLVNSSISEASIKIDHIQIEAPVFDSWPPQSYHRVFVESDKSADETTYAREILNRFMTKAWRRPIQETDLGKKLALFSKIREECDSFQDAMTEVLASVLASPQFLYLSSESSGIPTQTSAAEGQTKSLHSAASVDTELTTRRELLSSHELASRLAFFLWCSLPDDELLALAESGQLNSDDVLKRQVQRMLDDPRAKRFSKQFVSQWLNLELLDFVNLSEHVKHFEQLRADMRQEPIELFNEVLNKDLSLLNFLHADFVVLNERLAEHYGMDGVEGNDFRRIDLSGDPRRGGLLTQAAQLTMNSDYPDSHPLKRGVWLLNRVLNDPPPPPPPAVPQIDLANPEIAKMSLKERIEDHRNQAACKSCHVKIDPWGIAFENFDAIGRWRTEAAGKPIDASSELFNHQTLAGIEGLKTFLLEHRQDQFVRAMTHKIATYALGRPIHFEDSVDIELITKKVREQGDGLRTLIQEITMSELFRSK